MKKRIGWGLWRIRSGNYSQERIVERSRSWLWAGVKLQVSATGTHRERPCPELDKECFKCKGKGLFQNAKVFPKKSKNSAVRKVDSEQSTDLDNFVSRVVEVV